MSSRLVVLLLAAGICLAGQGCTARAWYEGLQERQRQECYRERSRDEMRQCLERADRLTYDEYVRGRKDSSTPPR
jgi:hypothetical protein